LSSSVSLVRRLLEQRCRLGVVLRNPKAKPVAPGRAVLLVGVRKRRPGPAQPSRSLSRRGVAVAVAVARPRCTLLRHSY
jgi:hypothetical protein